MPYVSNGTLKTDEREVAISETWDTQTEWEAYQSLNGIQINSGVLSLAEVTVPDAGELIARYDAQALSESDGASVSTWPDETGNGNDLTAGGPPTFNESGINTNPSLSFDGVDDYLNTALSTQNVPNTIASVVSLDTTGSFYQYLYDGSNADEQSLQQTNNGEWAYGAGTRSPDGPTDTQPHVFTALYNGSNSVLRIDGTEVHSGSAGTEALNGFEVGRRPDGQFYADAQLGEILIYPSDKSASFSDIESYLADKWGITL